MKTIDFSVEIKASCEKVWNILWHDTTYRQWTQPFQLGSYAISDWKQGSRIHFLSPKGEGMYSTIDKMEAPHQISFKHIGEIKNFEEMPIDEKARAWSGGTENYYLTTTDTGCKLSVKTDIIEEYFSFLVNVFPTALNIVKDLAEGTVPTFITVFTDVTASPELAWKVWTEVEHIKQWNNANDDWYTPEATNDLREGGKFIFTMAAKDGSFSFDFSGLYTEIVPCEKIVFTMDDGRKAIVSFSKTNNGCRIIESFEPESENSHELQRMGWQAILNNYQKTFIDYFNII